MEGAQGLEEREAAVSLPAAEIFTGLLLLALHVIDRFTCAEFELESQIKAFVPLSPASQLAEHAFHRAHVRSFSRA